MAKYMIQSGVVKCDHYSEFGKIEISANCNQKELEYLYSINYDGVFKLPEQETKKK